MRIMIMRSSSMGDIIHALPLAYDIKKHRPDVKIVWAVEKAFEDIVHLSPYVDEVVVSNFRGWRKKPWSSWSEFQAYRHTMRHLKLDRVLDIQGTLRSAYMCSLTKAPTWGYAAPYRRERLAGFAYQYLWELAPSIPAVTRYRLAGCRALGYGLKQEDLLPHFGLVAKEPPSLTLEVPYCAMCVNTSRDDKYWAQDRWVKLCRDVWETYGLTSVFFYGNDQELAIVQGIADQLDHAVIAPKDTLGRTASTLARARLLVGVDTGLTHLGAALGLPSVGIFVSTPVERVALVGDGPLASLGDNPTFEQVQEAVRYVLQINQPK